MKSNHWFGVLAAGALAAVVTTLVWSVPTAEKTATEKGPTRAVLERDNPIRPIPESPLGIDGRLADLEDPPTPERVRLGRWLFFDPRLSIDGTISCATCHRAPHGFSEPAPVSTGVDGKKGGRKAPPVLNMAFNIEQSQFWDGRAASLEEQAVGPMINPVEMAMPDHDTVVERLRAAGDYAPFFAEAFGDEEIDIERVGKAIADYERTRLSGNSAWDRWQADPDPEDAAIDIDAVTDMEGNINLEEIEFTDGEHVSAEVKLGHYVFFEKAKCNQCHFGPNFTDSQFHNLGVGWDPAEKKFADEGRFVVTGEQEDRGAFKTPTLREVSRRAPHMHDGSVGTLREVVELYVRGGEANPALSPKVSVIDISDREIDALVEFMEALEGEGYLDNPPASLPGASASTARAAAMATCGSGCGRRLGADGAGCGCRSGSGKGGCGGKGCRHGAR